MKLLLIILIFSLIAAGCSQPSVQPVVITPSVEPAIPIPAPIEPAFVMAQKIGSTKILITYAGAPDADQLMELETTVVSSKGSVTTKSMGSRLDTTPVQSGGTYIFQGPYAEEVHVLITAWYSNGSHVDVLDTRI